MAGGIRFSISAPTPHTHNTQNTLEIKSKYNPIQFICSTSSRFFSQHFSSAANWKLCRKMLCLPLLPWTTPKKCQKCLFISKSRRFLDFYLSFLRNQNRNQNWTHLNYLLFPFSFLFKFKYISIWFSLWETRKISVDSWSWLCWSLMWRERGAHCQCLLLLFFHSRRRRRRLYLNS